MGYVILPEQVEDVNDNPPQLNAVSYQGSLSEDAPSGTTVTLTPTIKVSTFLHVKDIIYKRLGQPQSR